MNRDKRGVWGEEGVSGAERGEGNGQMFSSSPTSTDPLLFNTGTLRMSTERLKDAAEKRNGERTGPERESIVWTSVKYDPLGYRV